MKGLTRTLLIAGGTLSLALGVVRGCWPHIGTPAVVAKDNVSRMPDGYPRGCDLPRKHPLGCKEVPCVKDEQNEL